MDYASNQNRMKNRGLTHPTLSTESNKNQPEQKIYNRDKYERMYKYHDKYSRKRAYTECCKSERLP